MRVRPTRESGSEHFSSAPTMIPPPCEARRDGPPFLPKSRHQTSDESSESEENSPLLPPFQAAVTYVGTNADGSCLLVGTTEGFLVWTVQPLRCMYTCACGPVTLVEMLLRTSLVAVVGSGLSPTSSRRLLTLFNCRVTPPSVSTSSPCSACAQMPGESSLGLEAIKASLVLPDAVAALRLTPERLVAFLHREIHFFALHNLARLHVLRREQLVILEPVLPPHLQRRFPAETAVNFFRPAALATKALAETVAQAIASAETTEGYYGKLSREEQEEDEDEEEDEGALCGSVLNPAVVVGCPRRRAADRRHFRDRRQMGGSTLGACDREEAEENARKKKAVEAATEAAGRGKGGREGDAVCAVCWTPQHSFLAVPGSKRRSNSGTASSPSPVRCDATTRLPSVAASAPQSSILSSTFSSFSVSPPGVVFLFDLSSLRCLGWRTAHRHRLTAMNFHHSGSRLATLSSRGTLARVFSVPDLTAVATLRLSRPSPQGPLSLPLKRGVGASSRRRRPAGRGRFEYTLSTLSVSSSPSSPSSSPSASASRSPSLSSSARTSDAPDASARPKDRRVSLPQLEERPLESPPSPEGPSAASSEATPLSTGLLSPRDPSVASAEPALSDRNDPLFQDAPLSGAPPPSFRSSASASSSSSSSCSPPSSACSASSSSSPPSPHSSSVSVASAKQRRKSRRQTRREALRPATPTAKAGEAGSQQTATREEEGSGEAERPLTSAATVRLLKDDRRAARETPEEEHQKDQTEDEAGGLRVADDGRLETQEASDDARVQKKKENMAFADSLRETGEAFNEEAKETVSRDGKDSSSLCGMLRRQDPVKPLESHAATTSQPSSLHEAAAAITSSSRSQEKVSFPSSSPSLSSSPPLSSSSPPLSSSSPPLSSSSPSRSSSARASLFSSLLSPAPDPEAEETVARAHPDVSCPAAEAATSLWGSVSSSTSNRCRYSQHESPSSPLLPHTAAFSPSPSRYVAECVPLETDRGSDKRVSFVSSVFSFSSVASVSLPSSPSSAASRRRGSLPASRSASWALSGSRRRQECAATDRDSLQDSGRARVSASQGERLLVCSLLSTHPFLPLPQEAERDRRSGISAGRDSCSGERDETPEATTEARARADGGASGEDAKGLRRLRASKTQAANSEEERTEKRVPMVCRSSPGFRGDRDDRRGEDSKDKGEVQRTGEEARDEEEEPHEAEEEAKRERWKCEGGRCFSQAGDPEKERLFSSAEGSSRTRGKEGDKNDNRRKEKKEKANKKRKKRREESERRVSTLEAQEGDLSGAGAEKRRDEDAREREASTQKERSKKEKETEESTHEREGKREEPCPNAEWNCVGETDEMRAADAERDDEAEEGKTAKDKLQMAEALRGTAVPSVSRRSSQADGHYTLLFSPQKETKKEKRRRRRQSATGIQSASSSLPASASSSKLESRLPVESVKGTGQTSERKQSTKNEEESDRTTKEKTEETETEEQTKTDATHSVEASPTAGTGTSFASAYVLCDESASDFSGSSACSLAGETEEFECSQVLADAEETEEGVLISSTSVLVASAVPLSLKGSEHQTFERLSSSAAASSSSSSPSYRVSASPSEKVPPPDVYKASPVPQTGDAEAGSRKEERKEERNEERKEERKEEGRRHCGGAAGENSHELGTVFAGCVRLLRLKAETEKSPRERNVGGREAERKELRKENESSTSHVASSAEGRDAGSVSDGTGVFLWSRERQATTRARREASKTTEQKDVEAQESRTALACCLSRVEDFRRGDRDEEWMVLGREKKSGKKVTTREKGKSEASKWWGVLAAHPPPEAPLPSAPAVVEPPAYGGVYRRRELSEKRERSSWRGDTGGNLREEAIEGAENAEAKQRPENVTDEAGDPSSSMPFKDARCQRSETAETAETAERGRGERNERERRRERKCRKCQRQVAILMSQEACHAGAVAYERERGPRIPYIAFDAEGSLLTATSGDGWVYVFQLSSASASSLPRPSAVHTPQGHAFASFLSRTATEDNCRFSASSRETPFPLSSPDGVPCRPSMGAAANQVSAKETNVTEERHHSAVPPFSSPSFAASSTWTSPSFLSFSEDSNRRDKENARKEGDRRDAGSLSASLGSYATSAVSSLLSFFLPGSEALVEAQSCCCYLQLPHFKNRLSRQCVPMLLGAEPTSPELSPRPSARVSSVSDGVPSVFGGVSSGARERRIQVLVATYSGCAYLYEHEAENAHAVSAASRTTLASESACASSFPHWSQSATPSSSDRAHQGRKSAKSCCARMRREVILQTCNSGLFEDDASW
uniref:Uncharacterized protein n=1 Tax=Toxoplasma gondii TgCATBr9 TaxID=943120 RepID=A0A2T6IPD3_TOXGO|nr:hypothetical protein TGBR9_242700 [Toxoplasma gondii TgCATBr9]